MSPMSPTRLETPAAYPPQYPPQAPAPRGTPAKHQQPTLSFPTPRSLSSGPTPLSSGSTSLLHSYPTLPLMGDRTASGSGDIDFCTPTSTASSSSLWPSPANALCFANPTAAAFDSGNALGLANHSFAYDVSAKEYDAAAELDPFCGGMYGNNAFIEPQGRHVAGLQMQWVGAALPPIALLQQPSMGLYAGLASYGDGLDPRRPAALADGIGTPWILDRSVDQEMSGNEQMMSPLSTSTPLRSLSPSSPYSPTIPMLPPPISCASNAADLSVYPTGELPSFRRRSESAIAHPSPSAHLLLSPMTESTKKHLPHRRKQRTYSTPHASVDTPGPTIGADQKMRELEELEQLQAGGTGKRREKRKLQNRLAQRAFRARSKVHQREAEGHMAQLERLAEFQADKLDTLTRLVERLQRENLSLKKERWAGAVLNEGGVAISPGNSPGDDGGGGKRIKTEEGSL